MEAFWKVIRIPFPDLGKKKLETGVGEIAIGEQREGGSWGSSDVKQAEVDNAGVDASRSSLDTCFSIHG